MALVVVVSGWWRVSYPMLNAITSILTAEIHRYDRLGKPDC